MNWGVQQTKAIEAVGQWLRKKNQPCFRLFGFAGTGKTTLAKYLAENVGTVFFAAYTGKAASVMRAKGCDQAMTIHQLIYSPADKSKQKLHKLQAELLDIDPDDPTAEKIKSSIRLEEERLKQPAFSLNLNSPIRQADLVVIDECSMVNDRMANDLLSFGAPILVLGDPAQLPPVRGAGFFTNAEPDFMLTEIHRQALNNPIIDLATRVRQGDYLPDGKYGNSEVMSGRPSPEQVMAADQILVGANLTRRSCNIRMRSLLGYGLEPTPIKGDRLVCLRNDHDVGLLNGTIWDVDDATNLEDCDRINLSIHGENKAELNIDAHRHYFEGREQDLDHWEIREAQCFDFGYALTTHKAQGSQWDNVFIFDESYLFKGHSTRWLYTAITRAAEKVTICRT